MSKYQFTRNYEFAGYPMVDTRARFLQADQVRRRRGDRNHGDGIPPLELRRAPPHHAQRRAVRWNASTRGCGSSAIRTTPRRSSRSHPAGGHRRSSQPSSCHARRREVPLSNLKPVTLSPAPRAGSAPSWRGCSPPTIMSWCWWHAERRSLRHWPIPSRAPASRGRMCSLSISRSPAQRTASPTSCKAAGLSRRWWSTTPASACSALPPSSIASSSSP